MKRFVASLAAALVFVLFVGDADAASSAHKGRGALRPATTSPAPPVGLPAPAGPAPRREVRRALAELGDAVTRCAATGGMPGTGSRRRLHVRTWLYPNNGAFTIEVPELATAGPHRNRYARTERCIQAAVTARVQPLMRRFTARTRIKIERAFVVRMPGPPPATRVLRRLVSGQRAALVRCVPGAGRRGERAAIIVRTTLARDGTLRLVGLGVPSAVDFDAAQACVTTALAEASTHPVTATATFETELPIRFAAPAPAH